MILERLEALPVGSFQYKLLMVTGLGWLFDSMDTGLIAFVLPVLTKDWGLSPAQAGWIGSIGLIGMALGAVLAGTVADRIGRKKVFTITVLLYSISTGLCALAWSYESLLVFRFLVGFGLGGELPVAATLMSEYAPSHLRGRFIVLLESFWGVGWLVAACIAYLLIRASAGRLPSSSARSQRSTSSSFACTCRSPCATRSRTAASTRPRTSSSNSSASSTSRAARSTAS